LVSSNATRFASRALFPAPALLISAQGRFRPREENLAGSPLYLEDIHPGMSWTSPPFTLLAEEIIAFARQYDPQLIHTDPKAAAAGPFGGLIASGWHLAALVMRQVVEAHPFGTTPVVGLGVDELRWISPARPGDMLQVRGEIVEVRASRSKPDRGVVRSRLSLFNQDEQPVMSLVTNTQVPAKAGQTG
jgi:acyl dehydratase